MTNFSPSSSSHLLVILNEFLQLKRDSSCCPAGCMMFISSLSLSPAAQRSTRARSIFLCCLWVCQPFCRFRFPFVSLFFHFIFVFVLFVLYLYFLQFFALGFWAVRQHSLTHIHQLSRSHLRAQFGNCSTSNFEEESGKGWQHWQNECVVVVVGALGLAWGGVDTYNKIPNTSRCRTFWHFCYMYRQYIPYVHM